MSVYIYVHTYIYIYMHQCTYIYILIYIYIHIVYIYIDVDVYGEEDRDRTYHKELFPQKSPVGFQLPLPFLTTVHTKRHTQHQAHTLSQTQFSSLPLK